MRFVMLSCLVFMTIFSPLLQGSILWALPRNPPAIQKVGGDLIKSLVRQRLDDAFMPGLPWKLLHLSLSPQDKLGVIVEVLVDSQSASPQEQVELIEKSQEKVATTLREFLEREFEHLELARYGAVIFKDPGTMQSWIRWLNRPEESRAIGRARLTTVRGSDILEEEIAPGSPDHVRWVRHRSQATKLGQRLRRDLAQTFPDPFVEVLAKRPPAVQVNIQVFPRGVNEVNRPHVESYVKALLKNLVVDEFPDLTLRNATTVQVSSRLRWDLPDTEYKRKQVTQNRTPRHLVGLSNRIEGRIRAELMDHFPKVEISTLMAPSPYPDAHQLLANVVVKTDEQLDEDNRPLIRSYLKRVVGTLLAYEFPQVYLSPRCRFVVWSPHENIEKGLTAPTSAFGSVRMGEPTRPGTHIDPVGPPRKGRPRIEAGFEVSERLTGIRGRIVEMPTAYLTKSHGDRFELRFAARTLGSGVFQDVGGLSMTIIGGTLRGKILPFLEGSLGFESHSLTGTHAASMNFDATSPGMGVISGGLKLGVPLDLAGWRLALGGNVSLISDLDQPVFFPEDHGRFNNVYAVVSRPLYPNFHFHLASRLGLVSDGTDQPGSEAKTVSTVGFGADYQPNPQVRLMVEFLNDRFSDPATQTLGTYGRNLKWDGLSVNLGLTAGVRGVGDVRAHVRRANRSDDLEAGVSILTRI